MQFYRLVVRGIAFRCKLPEFESRQRRLAVLFGVKFKMSYSPSLYFTGV
jgi:hypothetical protein